MIRHWSNKFDKSVRSVSTRVEVVTAVPVFLLLIDVFADGAFVEEPVLGDCFGKFAGFFEDFGPFADAAEVVVHVVAEGERDV